MVHRQGSVLDAYLYAAAHSQFVGMDLGPQAAGRSGGENPVRILDREESFVAENIHEISEFRCLGHHIDHRLHVPFVRVAPADGMGTQEGDPDERRDGLPDAPDHPQHLEFILRIQPVAALDLQGAGSLGHHFPDAYHRLLIQFVLGRLVQQVGGIQNPTAPGGDLLVAEPVDLVQELSVPAPRIYDVRMAVAERRHHHAALGVDDGRFDKLTDRLADRQIGHLAESCNLPVLDDEPGILQYTRLRHLGALLPQHARRHDPDEFTDVFDKDHRYCSCRRNWTDFSMSGCM